MNRTEQLKLRIIAFAKGLLLLPRDAPQTPINAPLINQLVRSSTSIGANYCEAVEGESRKDFIHKLSICKKKVKETLYWIELLAELNEAYKDAFRIQWKEAREFLLLFSRSLDTMRNKQHFNEN